MFGFGSKRSIEEKMAEWLAHPNEFGVRPASVRFKRTYKGKLITHGDVEIHLVEYRMPDGTAGRGFVNGPLTWSFLGGEVNSISDGDLLLAYCGWAWLFPALQGGTVQTDFVSAGEEARFLSKKKAEGFESIQLTSRYKIGTSELFEFTATRHGKTLKGAGDSNVEVSFGPDDPKCGLPSIYYLLAGQVIQSMR